MMDLVSVIVPVYNVEKYIEDALRSILSQTHSKLEVILVDDGSTDSSGNICDAFAKEDPRIICFHTLNQGAGKARNFGLSHATGKYCFFMDPDDLVEPYTVAYLYDLAEKNNAEIAVGEVQTFSRETTLDQRPENIAVYRNHADICEKVVLDNPCLKPLDQKKVPGTVNYLFCTCLYSRALLEREDISFLPISYGEDTYFCFKALLCAQCVVTTKRIVYWYRRNMSSASFRYHNNYLAQTKEYYDSYCRLFEEYAPEYLLQATIGLEGQYTRRCITAIERELLLAPQSHSIPQRKAVIWEICNDSKFKKQFTWENLRVTVEGKSRMLLSCIKLRLIVPAVWFCKTFYSPK